MSVEQIGMGQTESPSEGDTLGDWDLSVVLRDDGSPVAEQGSLDPAVEVVHVSIRSAFFSISPLTPAASKS
jgi:hypothetical protein